MDKRTAPPSGNALCVLYTQLRCEDAELVPGLRDQRERELLALAFLDTHDAERTALVMLAMDELERRSAEWSRARASIPSAALASVLAELDAYIDAADGEGAAHLRGYAANDRTETGAR
jgi:hypothetical protein